MSILMESPDARVEQDLTWTVPLSNWNLDYVSEPEELLSDACCRVVGMDGNDTRGMTRSRGFKLWMDPTQATLFKTYLTGTSTSLPFNCRQVLEAVPFCLAKCDTTGYVYGSVYQVLVRADTDAWAIESYVIWHNNTKQRLWNPIVSADSCFKLRSMGTFTDATIARDGGLLHGTSFGRFLYLFRPNFSFYSSAPSDAFQQHTVLWAGDSCPARYPADRGTDVDGTRWFMDWFGVPAGQATWADGFNVPIDTTADKVNGRATAGIYKSGFRLVDSERGRYSNASFRLITYDQYLEQTQSPDAANEFVATMSGSTRSALLLYGGIMQNTPSKTFPYLASDNATGIFMWDKWHPLCSLSSQSTTEPAAGVFYVVDELPTHADFRAFDLTGDWASMWGTYTAGGTYPNKLGNWLFAGITLSHVFNVETDGAGTADPVSRNENYTLVDFYGAIGTAADGNGQREVQYSPMTDEVLAALPRYDPVMDTFFTYSELGQPYASTMFMGSMFLLTRPRPNVTDEVEVNDQLYIMWSDPRRVAPENFSAACFFPTEFRLTAAPALGQTNLVDVDITQLVPPKAAFVAAAGNLYALGDGPVYKISYDPASELGFYVGQIDDGRVLCSKHSCVSFGAAALIVTEKGVFVLDGGTDTFYEVLELQRLLTKRWTTEALRGSISCAYDSLDQTVSILCGRTGELVRIWLKTNRVTMDEYTNFTMVREGIISVDGISNRRRALYYTQHGRCYYSSDDPGEGDGRLTQHTLAVPTPSTQIKPDVAGLAAPWLYVADTHLAAESYVNGHGRCIGLDLRDAPEGEDPPAPRTATPPGASQGTSAPVLLNPALARDMVIEILDGPKAGYVFTSTPLAPSEYPDVDGTIAIQAEAEDLLPSDVEGHWIQLSPLHSYVVGGPLPGATATRLLERIHAKAVLPGAVRLSASYVEMVSTVSSIQVGMVRPAALIATETKPDTRDIRGQYARPLDGWLDFHSTTITMSDCPAAGVMWDDDRPYKQFAWLAAPYNVTGHTLLPVFYARTGGWDFHLFWLMVCGTIAPTMTVK